MAMPNEQLEAARMHKRWSVALASEKAGVSINTFNRWERGLQVPQLSTLDQVCKAFDMSPEDLGFEHAITAKRHTLPCQQVVPAPVRAVNPIPLLQPPSVTRVDHIITPVQWPICDVSASDELVKRSLEYMRHEQHKKDGSVQDLGDKGFSRRQAIAALLGTPATVFGLTQDTHAPLLHPEEVVSLCKVGIPLSWRLYFEGGLTEVNQTLSTYLTQLKKLAQEPSMYQKKAAGLASQGYQLASLLSLQYQNFGFATTYASHAFEYANLAEDAHLQTASLIRQAQVYYYLRRPQQRLQIYERAKHYSRNASALLQGRVYIGLTETHSHLVQTYEANRYLELAHQIFPEHSEEDQNFAYTHFSHRSLFSFEGMMHLNLGDPLQAWKSFMSRDNIISRAPIPERLELTVKQAQASCALGDPDQSCAYLEAAVRTSLATGNLLRYDETCKIYENMQSKWGKENRIKDLGRYFQWGA